MCDFVYEYRDTTYNPDTCCEEDVCICLPDPPCPHMPNCTEYEVLESIGYLTTHCCEEFECICAPEDILIPLCEEFHIDNCTDPGATKVTQVSNVTECCMEDVCICEQCVIDGVLYDVGDVINGTDPCTVYKCTEDDLDDPLICPSFELFHNYTDDCAEPTVTCLRDVEEVITLPIPGTGLNGQYPHAE